MFGSGDHFGGGGEDGPDMVGSKPPICTLSPRYEDLNWSGVQNAGLIKGILIRLRTRPAQTAFKWVKGHADNYGNNRADSLANDGRMSNSQLVMDEDNWINTHPALQDGARLQALEAKHMYSSLLEWHMKRVTPIPHQDKLDEAKDKVEETTGL